MPGIMISPEGKTPEEISKLVADIQERVRVAIEGALPADMPYGERHVVHCMLMMESIQHIPSFDIKLRRCYEIMGEFIVAAAYLTAAPEEAQKRWVEATRAASVAQEGIFQLIQREQDGTKLQ